MDIKKKKKKEALCLLQEMREYDSGYQRKTWRAERSWFWTLLYYTFLFLNEMVLDNSTCSFILTHRIPTLNQCDL